MNPLNRQTELLEKLCQIIHYTAPENYEEIICNFILNVFEGWSETELKYLHNDIYNSIAIKEDEPMQIFAILNELHALMKAHTGGEWTSFTLTLNKDGKAHTKFHYPEAKSE